MNEELKVQLPNGTLKVLSCTAHTFGEFAGNLDVVIACEPALVRQVTQHLKARVPDESPLAAIAHGKTPQGVDLVYHAVSVSDRSSAPSEVEFLWEDRELGRMACSTEGGGQAVEQAFEFISAEKARNLAGKAVSRLQLDLSTRQPIGHGPGPAVLFLALFLAGVGAFMLFYGVATGFSDHVSAGVIGLGLLLISLLVFRFVNPAQNWLDWPSGSVVTVRGAWLFGKILWAREERRPAAQFHHVRIVEGRTTIRRASGGTTERSTWLVSLEGSVPTADGEGNLHRRRDALPIGESTSHEQALAMAADAADRLKIPILDTGKRWV